MNRGRVSFVVGMLALTTLILGSGSLQARAQGEPPIIAPTPETTSELSYAYLPFLSKDLEAALPVDRMVTYRWYGPSEEVVSDFIDYHFSVPDGEVFQRMVGSVGHLEICEGPAPIRGGWGTFWDVPVSANVVVTLAVTNTVYLDWFVFLCLRFLFRRYYTLPSVYCLIPNNLVHSKIPLMKILSKEEILEKINSLPKTPGVYKFFNKNGSIIYVGKAINLRSRVGSYFKIKLDGRTKTYALVQEIINLSTIETTSEIEALILEAALIKKHKPHYNINLKDNKSFLYIVIRPSKVVLPGVAELKIGSVRTRTLHQVLVARKQDLLKGDLTFGPFPSSEITRSVVKMIRKTFPYRDCSASKFSRYHKQEKPCLYGHITLCPSPCVHHSDRNIKQYQTGIKRIRQFLQGKTGTVLREINRKMQQASKEQSYEQAAYYRDILEKFEYVRQRFHTPREFMENPYLIYDLADRALTELRDVLPHLTKLPERIEGYDISTISGKDAVGSMVVALMGRIDKSEYKRFKIRKTSSPDDFEMMREVLLRRLKREVSKDKKKIKWGLPDLILVDGGKGQVSAALDVIEDVGVNVCVAGLAKKQEILVFFHNGHFHEINLPRNSPGLQLLIKLRDESHRFAQAYHHLLRKRRLRVS